MNDKIYQYLTEEQIEEILNKYDDISSYIKDQTFEYKKDTTDLMDDIKYIFFTYLLLNMGKQMFSSKIQDRMKNYEKDMLNKSDRAYKTIADLTKYINKGKYTIDNKTSLKNELKALAEKYKRDFTSTKAENDKFIRVLTNYYKRTEKTLANEWVQANEYLSKKVSEYDKMEKTVAYNRNNAKNGIAYYDIATYDSMVYNSNLTRTAILENIKDAERQNYDSVYVEPHPYSCELCQEWQGKMYSLTGQSIGEEVNGYKIKMLLSDCKGLFHPNCSHTFHKVEAENKVTNKYSGGNWNERYDAKQKKQSLELKKQRLLNDNKIYKELGDQASIDENNQKIKRLREEIKEQKNIMLGGK